MSFAFDFFTGTPNTELSVYNANWSTLGSFTDTAVIGVDSGTYASATAPSASYSIYKRSESPASADYSVFADVQALFNGWAFLIGVIGRADNASTSCYTTMQHNASSELRLYKIQSASFTQLGSYSNTPGTTNQNHELRMTGTTIEAYLDGVQRISVTDSDISAAGKAGILLFATREFGVADRAKLDNFNAVDSLVFETAFQPNAFQPGAFQAGPVEQVAVLSAQIAATDSSDTAAITAANWRTAQIAATDSSDVAAITGNATQPATIAATDSSDTAAIATSVTAGAAIAATDASDTAALVAANWRTGTIAATDASDTAALVAANWTTAQIVAIDGADNAAIATGVTTGAAIVATDSSDTVAILAEGNASITSGSILATETGDNADLQAEATVGAAIAATDSSDSAALTAANWRTGQIAATESADTAAIAASVTTQATIAATDSPDNASIATGVTSASIEATDSPDTAAIVGGLAQETIGGGGAPFRPERRLFVEALDAMKLQREDELMLYVAAAAATLEMIE